MNRQTITQYGMIIVAVLIVLVLIMLATPFGNFIVQSIDNIRVAYQSTSDKLLSEENIEEKSKDMYQLFDTSDILLPGMYPSGQVMEELTGQGMIDNSYVIIEDGVLKKGTNISKIHGDYIMQDEVTSIEAETFKSCDKLTMVRLSDSTTTIGKDAFNDCSSLEILIAGNNLTTIKAGAFNNCTSLKTVYLNNSIKYIENNAFINCPSLEEIYFDGTTGDFVGVLQHSANHGDIWYSNTTLKRIVCTNGVITAL